MDNNEIDDSSLQFQRISDLLGSTLGKISLLLGDIINTEIHKNEIYFQLRQIWLEASRTVDYLLA